MKAIVIDEYGGPEVLRYTDHEDPKMGTEGILSASKPPGSTPSIGRFVKGSWRIGRSRTSR